MDKARAKSAAKSAKAPWATDFAEMCEKTVLGPVLKRLPKVPGQPPSDPDVYMGEGGLAPVVNLSVASVPEALTAGEDNGVVDVQEVQEADVYEDDRPPDDDVKKRPPVVPPTSRTKPKAKPKPKPKPKPTCRATRFSGRKAPPGGLRPVGHRPSRDP